MAVVLQHSRKGASESIGMVTEYDALSTQHTAPSPSPSSSEEQFIESSSSSAEYQFTNASDPPSAQVPSSGQNKTIAFIGDSLGRQQFESIMCMASGGEESPEVEDIASEYGLVKPPGAIRPQGWVYRFPSTNTTILFYWSVTLCDLVPLNKAEPNVALHLDRPPPFLIQNLHRFDVLVLNTGHHWNTAKLKANRWVIHVNGKPIKKKSLLQDMRNAKNFTVHSIVKWVDSQLGLYPQLKALFRTISPRHFPNGELNSCNNSNQDEYSSDKVVESAVKGTKVKILDITAISQLRNEAHMSNYSIQGINDCLHWCLPGVPDTWNELLIAQI
ncbi:PC-Esterase [Corchorus olitorius]|uniref:PC-Esterase n=1 Tax=Corchorus olitorius TaxID=93759 RepID=A0A1R3GDE5_9ROSI|nr:PC-Esterase [Corchorus olitorius]